jgi:hypothetical protein
MQCNGICKEFHGSEESSQVIDSKRQRVMIKTSSALLQTSLNGMLQTLGCQEGTEMKSLLPYL